MTPAHVQAVPSAQQGRPSSPVPCSLTAQSQPETMPDTTPSRRENHGGLRNDRLETCYANAIIQLLTHNDAFVVALHQVPPTRASEALLSIQAVLLHGGEASVDPLLQIPELKCFRPRSGYHDATEFLGALLQALDHRQPHENQATPPFRVTRTLIMSNDDESDVRSAVELTVESVFMGLHRAPTFAEAVSNAVLMTTESRQMRNQTTGTLQDHNCSLSCMAEWPASLLFHVPLEQTHTLTPKVTDMPPAPAKLYNSDFAHINASPPTTDAVYDLRCVVYFGHSHYVAALLHNDGTVEHHNDTITTLLPNRAALDTFAVARDFTPYMWMYTRVDTLSPATPAPTITARVGTNTHVDTVSPATPATPTTASVQKSSPATPATLTTAAPADEPTQPQHLTRATSPVTKIKTPPTDHGKQTQGTTSPRRTTRKRRIKTIQQADALPTRPKAARPHARVRHKPTPCPDTRLDPENQHVGKRRRIDITTASTDSSPPVRMEVAEGVSTQEPVRTKHAAQQDAGGPTHGSPRRKDGMAQTRRKDGRALRMPGHLAAPTRARSPQPEPESKSRRRSACDDVHGQDPTTTPSACERSEC